MASPAISRIQAIGWPLLTFTPLEGMSAVVAFLEQPPPVRQLSLR